jgi:ABC-type Fe3+ transport system permease subunit
MKPHRATAVLVLGILSLVTCPLLGVAAWVMGNNDLREMGSGQMDPTGRENTNAGRICGIIGTMFLILWFVVMLFMFGIMGFAGVVSSRSAKAPQSEVTPGPGR